MLQFYKLQCCAQVEPFDLFGCLNLTVNIIQVAITWACVISNYALVVLLFGRKRHGYKDVSDVGKRKSKKMAVLLFCVLVFVYVVAAGVAVGLGVYSKKLSSVYGCFFGFCL